MGENNHEQEMEVRMSLVEQEQKHLIDTINTLSNNIAALTAVVTQLQTKGSDKWDKLVWLIIGGAVAWVFKTI